MITQTSTDMETIKVITRLEESFSNFKDSMMCDIKEIKEQTIKTNGHVARTVERMCVAEERIKGIDVKFKDIDKEKKYLMNVNIFWIGLIVSLVAGVVNIVTSYFFR